MPTSGASISSRARQQAADENHDGYRYAVSPGYFEVMGIPLRQGRVLNSHDVAGAPPAAVISESFAKRRLPGLNPIGQRLSVGPIQGPGTLSSVSLATSTDLARSESDKRRLHDNGAVAHLRTTHAGWWFAHTMTRRLDACHPRGRSASVDKNQPICASPRWTSACASLQARRRLRCCCSKRLASWRWSLLRSAPIACSPAA